MTCIYELTEVDLCQVSEVLYSPPVLPNQSAAVSKNTGMTVDVLLYLMYTKTLMHVKQHTCTATQTIDTGKEKGLATEVAVNFIRVSPYVLKNGVHSKKLTYAGRAYTRRTKNTRSLRT